MSQATVSVAEARNNFSKIGAAVVRSGQPVTVFRNSRPWLVISPAPVAGADEGTYERDYSRVLERGEADVSVGGYVSLADFLAAHPER